VVLHYTAMPDAASAERALCDPAREVSCHWLIARDGTVTALVDEEMRAWHAGAGSWGGREDVNSRSIGIELDNDGASPFAAPLMDALEELLGGILARWTSRPPA
jgi:N-acetylmuramoyl-L-alanine amidase